MAEKFAQIYTRACERKGGEAAVEALLSTPLSRADVAKLSDHRFLSAMTKKGFSIRICMACYRAKMAQLRSGIF